MEAGDAARLPEAVRTAVRAVIAERAGQRVGQLVGRIVDDLEGEHRHRHRAVAVVVRNERRQRREPHPAGEALVLEHQIGGREAAVELDLAEMRHPGQRLAVGAMPKTVEHFPEPRRAGGVEIVGAVEHPGIDQFALPFGLDGEMRIAVIALQRRLVADRPVDQPPAAGNGKPARTDTAERKGEVAGALPGIGKARIDRGKIIPHQTKSLKASS